MDGKAKITSIPSPSSFFAPLTCRRILVNHYHHYYLPPTMANYLSPPERSVRRFMKRRGSEEIDFSIPLFVCSI
jgi:hypothetical protein